LVQMPINICKAFIEFSQICNIIDISVGFNRMFTSIRRKLVSRNKKNWEVIR